MPKNLIINISRLKYVNAIPALSSVGVGATCRSKYMELHIIAGRFLSPIDHGEVSAMSLRQKSYRHWIFYCMQLEVLAIYRPVGSHFTPTYLSNSSKFRVNNKSKIIISIQHVLQISNIRMTNQSIMNEM